MSPMGIRFRSRNGVPSRPPLPVSVGVESQHPGPVMSRCPDAEPEAAAIAVALALNVPAGLLLAALALHREGQRVPRTGIEAIAGRPSDVAAGIGVRPAPKLCPEVAEAFLEIDRT
jgi:hypothetical protein